MKRRLELLAPARDMLIGKAAIDNGADAVYIGAPAFGARKAAGNSIADIRTLAEYAHRFYCKVYVTFNTLLYDSELAEAEKLIRQLYEAGVDALIIQDMGILKMDIPPIALHASTQMHNYDPEKIVFLDRLGFQRIVLARELSLEQLRSIRRQVQAELEVFIHGALCVCLSGQCYLSHYLSGRSANRGECMQACRMRWTLEDREGKVLVKDKYLLSLKDLNLSDYISGLMELGIDSFKIEGRLKDENYVSNIVNHYHSLITSMGEEGKERPERTGSGVVSAGFAADPAKSFNRGFTDYFMRGRQQGLVNMDTPKSVGKFIGRVKRVKGNRLWIELEESLHNGDGLCYPDNGKWKGIRVNIADGDCIECNEIPDIRPGMFLYRNYDRLFVAQTERKKSVRKIRIIFRVTVQEGKLTLCVEDEDGVQAVLQPEEVFGLARDERQRERMAEQLKKCGGSEYICQEVFYEGETVFVPSARLNSFRRSLLELLTEERAVRRERGEKEKPNREVKWKEKIGWRDNVTNRLAEQFYREHGAREVEAGFETGRPGKERELMCTRYCLLYELGHCRKAGNAADIRFPLFLSNAQRRFRLEFDCEHCFMKIIS